MTGVQTCALPIFAALSAADGLCRQHGVNLGAIEAAPAGSMERLGLIDEATNALVSPDQLRNDFLNQHRSVTVLFAAVQPAIEAADHKERVSVLGAIAEAIQAKVNPAPPDISHVLSRITEILDEAILGTAIPQGQSKTIDLSKIDFGALADRFARSKQKNVELEALRAAVRVTLGKMVAINRTRIDFVEKFEALIREYNEGSAAIEEVYRELLALSRSLSEEQERHVRESLSEEELVILDILTKPAPDLSSDERDQVKKAARILLEKIKGVLVLDWRQKEQARSKLRVVIEKTLDDELPPAYSKEVFDAKCSALFEHVYESYRGANESIYQGAA